MTLHDRDADARHVDDRLRHRERERFVERRADGPTYDVRTDVRRPYVRTTFVGTDVRRPFSST